MRISLATSLLLLTSLATSRVIPRPDVVVGDVEAVPVVNDAFDLPDLEKRRGGGGGKGGSGGGSGGRSGSGGSTSSSGSSSSGSRGSSSSSSSSSKSNVGGFTKTGSGTPRTYGGGSYYAGGASVPYTAGARSPLGVTPYLLPIGALAVISSLWVYDAFAYPWSHPYIYHNPTTGTDETLPVVCLCQEYSECGCDNNNNSTYVDSILGNNLTNSSVVWIATVIIIIIILPF